MIYPIEMSREDIAEFQAEYEEWLDEELTVAERERRFIAANSVELSEELYSPYWGA